MSDRTPSDRPEQDPYNQLTEMHKLTDELKAEIAALKSKLHELEGAIRQHHEEVFKTPEGGK